MNLKRILSEKEEQPEMLDTESDPDSEIGEWKKQGDGWSVEFQIGEDSYGMSFTPLDEKEKHWKFIYYRNGMRDSSDIEKFGEVNDWEKIWGVLVEIIKDFVKIFKPQTLKFIGMTHSKRPKFYHLLYKMYVKNFVDAFRKQKYKSSFDNKRFESSPSFVVMKKKPAVQKEAVEDNVKFKLDSTTKDRRILSGEWIQPEKFRKEGDDGKYIAIKVEFIDPKNEVITGSIISRFKDKIEGMKWARGVKPTKQPDDLYVKNFGTGME